jgi:hypothetical protein
MSKIEDFLKASKIDPRRILVASEKLEKLHPEDRSIRLAARQARKSEDGGKKKEGDRKKPRSGRPVTPRTLTAALKGKDITGPAKTRVLRAVNHVLAQKKLEQVALAALFDAPSKGNKKEKAAAEPAS